MKIIILKYRYIFLLLLLSSILAIIYSVPGSKHGLSDDITGTINLSKEEIEWIKRNPVITVGVDLDFAPIEYLDKNNHYIGVTADFLALLENKTGLRFEIDYEHSWEESIERIKDGKIHMLGAAVSSEQRRQFMDFTQPYAWLSGVIIVRKTVTEPMSLEKLKGMKVAVVYNYIWKDILETSHPELDISPASNIETALKKVSFGMTDAMVGFMATASHHIERLGISNLKISGETVSVLDISFAINKETHHLKDILNRALEKTTQEQRKTIIRKWISLELGEITNLKWFTRILFPGIVVILLGLIAIIIWNRSLQRQVNQRTRKLNQELVQRTHIEQALRESEEKYRSIFGNIQDVYYEIIPKGQILEISPSIEKVFGYTRKSMLQRKLSHMFVNPEDVIKMLEKIIKEERLADYEALLVRPDGAMLNCSMNAMLVKNAHGEPLKIIGSIRNISDRVKAQKALRKSYHELEKRVQERTAELRNTNKELNKAMEAADAATQAKSNFLANMSHEIRTPLSGVISASELVMYESPPNKIARYINIIHTSGQALLGVIDDILDFSKIEAGKLDIEIRPFHLEQLINRTTNIFKHKIAKKQIVFLVDVKPDTQAHLIGDSFRLQQILTNLLSNAVKFTDKGGNITLEVFGEVSKKKDPIDTGELLVTFLVTDTGIGISPEHQDLLFTPFSQVDASTTRKYGGSGLGLSICGQLVEMMKGKISVESDTEKGSRFLFSIPLKVWENPDLEKTASSLLVDQFHTIEIYKSLLSGKRILVAEDTPISQEIIQAVLELAGIETILVDTGIKAVEAVQKEIFDAVLMDIQMPEMDGLEATRVIRKKKDQGNLPIVAMTAHTLKEDKAKCIAAGMNGYISKPIHQEKLFKTLISFIYKESDHDVQNVTLLPKPDQKIDITKISKSFNSLPMSVPGIELKKAMDALGIKADVFIRILQTFFTNHEHILLKIETAWDKKNQEEVIILVHSLKGSAAGIGAVELYQLALDIEKMCRKTDSLPSMEKARLAILENVLTIVLASIKSLVSEYADLKHFGFNKEKFPVIIDVTRVKAVLKELEQALRFPEFEELELLMQKLALFFEDSDDHSSSQAIMEELKNNILSHDHDFAEKNVKKLQSHFEGQA